MTFSAEAVGELELNDSTVGDSKETVNMGDGINVRFEQAHNPKIKLPCLELA